MENLEFQCLNTLLENPHFLVDGFKRLFNSIEQGLYENFQLTPNFEPEKGYLII
ncbi:hypothetical protein NIES4071_99880 [Calothrix sp. NIES-4071]|nr:hypothetical protein NIES4071_99880 [Calothrix sp. NIES-4071]BAZ64250.1 hypothetical protein NIES4105_99810 [Calothrix sp. NIES-4105]